MMKCLVAIAAVFFMTAAEAQRDPLPVVPPHLEMQVAKLTVLPPAVLRKDGSLFVSPASEKGILELKAGMRVFLTGEKRKERSEVWISEIGEGWVLTENIRVLEPDPKK